MFIAAQFTIAKIMEAAWMFSDRLMDKEDVVNMHNGIYSTIKKMK